jgi:hypothetical protein
MFKFDEKSFLILPLTVFGLTDLLADLQLNFSILHFKIFQLTYISGSKKPQLKL